MHRLVNLDALADILCGYPFKGRSYGASGIRVLRGENVTVGDLRWDVIKCINHSDEFDVDKYSLRGDDIVIGMDGSKVGQNRAQIKNDDLPLVLAQRVARLRAKNTCDPKFLYYLTRWNRFEEYVLQVQTGSSIPHISQTQIAEYKVPEIPFSQQQKIGLVLSHLDERINLNRKANTQLESITTLIYNYWFKQFDFPNADGKPYRYSGGGMVYDNKLKRHIPKGWTALQLGDICHVKNRQLKNDDIWEYYLYLETSALTKNTISNLLRIDNADALPSRAKRIVGANDIVYSTVRPNQEHYGIIKNPIKNLVVSTGFTVLSHNSNVAYNDFIFQFLKSTEVINRLQTIADSAVSSYPSINPDDILNLWLPYPSEPEIIRNLSIQLSQLNEAISRNHQQNQTLSELRDWLLPLLMNGQVQVMPEKLSKALNTKGDPAFDENSTSTLQNKPISISQNKRPFAKRVLAGKIVSLFNNDPHFSHIKFQKVHYLAEHIAQAKLDSAFYFQAAGPYDPSFMHSIARNLKTSKWFDERNYKWYPLEKQYQIDEYFDGFFKPATEKLHKLFALLLKMTEAESEIVATLYAVWNNRILSKQSISEQDLIDDFYAWSNRKQGYSENQVRAGLKWIAENDMQPVGFGQLVKRAKKKS